ncbi:MAG: DUF2752 domain-containing protein [Cyanobium sp.]
MRSTRLRPWLRQLRGMGHVLPAALSGYLAIKGLHPDLPGWSCPLRALTGIPCPTCYLSRATSQALLGHLDQAIQLHAFGPLLAAGLLVWSLASWRSGRLQPWPPQARWPAPVAAGAGAALLMYWLLRLWVRAAGLAAPLPGLAFPSG